MWPIYIVKMRRKLIKCGSNPNPGHSLQAKFTAKGPTKASLKSIDMEDFNL